MISKLNKIIIIGVIAIIIFAVGGFYANKWFVIKMKKVQLGLAESTFPYRSYTQEELNKMYPQIKYADVATRTTPEETYAKFRKALKENNLEMAIEQFSRASNKRYKKYVDLLTKFYKENKFKELYKYYPEKIIKSSMYESIAQYNYDKIENGEVFINSIDFTKDANGDWKLDSL